MQFYKSNAIVNAIGEILYKLEELTEITNPVK